MKSVTSVAAHRVLPPAPRWVRLRRRSWSGVWTFRLISSGVLLGGIWMVWISLQGPLTAGLGRKTEAVVEQVSPLRGDRSGRWFEVGYSCAMGSERWFGNDV